MSGDDLCGRCLQSPLWAFCQRCDRCVCILCYHESFVRCLDCVAVFRAAVAAKADEGAAVKSSRIRASAVNVGTQESA